MAAAQALSCRVPASPEVPRLVQPPRGTAPRVVPVTGYLLALSWSPDYCAGRTNTRDRRDDFQCSGAGGRFGWVLHGLWPEGATPAYPMWCRPARIVPQAVICQQLCVSPSAQLIQRQWAKHGTCMSASPDAYFRASRILFRAVRFPDKAAPMASAGDVRRAFAAVNRGVRPDMVAVITARGGWLREVRFCLDGRMRPVRCLPHQRGAADRVRVGLRAP